MDDPKLTIPERDFTNRRDTQENLSADLPAPDSDTPSFEGKKVFSPGELNNAGEDKDYFQPKKDHRYEVPKDANDHAIKPDVEMAPGNKVKPLSK